MHETSIAPHGTSLQSQHTGAAERPMHPDVLQEPEALSFAAQSTIEHDRSAPEPMPRLYRPGELPTEQTARMQASDDLAGSQTSTGNSPEDGPAFNKTGRTTEAAASMGADEPSGSVSGREALVGTRPDAGRASIQTDGTTKIEDAIATVGSTDTDLGAEVSTSTRLDDDIALIGTATEPVVMRNTDGTLLSARDESPTGQMLQPPRRNPGLAEPELVSEPDTSSGSAREDGSGSDAKPPDSMGAEVERLNITPALEAAGTVQI